MTTVDDGLPPIAAQRLTAFLGEWQVDGSLTAEQVPVAVTGNWRFERVVEGWGVLGAMDTEIEGMGAFGERELIGFDAVEEKIHLFSMNKFTIRDHRGGWIDDNKLVVRYEGVHDGTQVSEEITIDFIDPDRIIGRVVEQADGVIMITTDLKMKRRA